jgi:hypothetical protein
MQLDTRTFFGSRLLPLCLPLAFSLAVGSACTTSEPKQQAPRIIAGLMLIETDNHGILFVKPEHFMASYDRVILDPIRITFKKGSPKLSEQETQKLAIHLREATAREIIGLTTDKLVKTPGPCVLRIQTSFADLELPRMTATTDASSTIVSQNGTVTLLHAVRDSLSGELLLHYAERRATPGGQLVGAGAQWRRMTGTFDKMLASLQDELVAKVPMSYARSGALAQCKGEVYKQIEESAH